MAGVYSPLQQFSRKCPLLGQVVSSRCGIVVMRACVRA
jgi:hypothetical protein